MNDFTLPGAGERGRRDASKSEEGTRRGVLSGPPRNVATKPGTGIETAKGLPSNTATGDGLSPVAALAEAVGASLALPIGDREIVGLTFTSLGGIDLHLANGERFAVQSSQVERVTTLFQPALIHFPAGVPKDVLLHRRTIEGPDVPRLIFVEAGR